MTVETTFNKSFYRGSRGAVFSKKAPLAAGSKKKAKKSRIGGYYGACCLILSGITFY